MPVLDNQTLGIFLALLSSVVWGFNGIFLRKGFEKVDLVSGTFSLILISTVISLFFAVLDLRAGSILDVRLDKILMLILAGILSYFIGRLFTYFSVSTIGSSRAFAGTSTRILFSAIFGVFLLKETFNSFIFIGSLFMILGLSIFSTEGFDKKGIYASVIGGLLYGVAALFVKIGMLESVFVTNSIAFISGLFFLTIYTSIKKKLKLVKDKFILFSGITLYLGQILFYAALGIAPLTIVAPLSNLYPLVTASLSYIFIQKLEKIKIKTFVGSLLTVMGSILIIIGC